MNVEEIPLAFDCREETLIGIVHRPESPSPRGVLTLVAGGPQYRAGCCRQLVYLARDLGAHGIPVMRFDHRGLGDGAGAFLDFEHVGEDLAAAIAAFRRAVPELREIVLWGGCNAASGILIHAPLFPEVTGLILSNPYAHSEATQAVVVRKHYLRRLGEPAFWGKVFRLRFNPLPLLRAALGRVFSRLRPRRAGPGAPRPFLERMLQGFSAFRGRILLVMSGQSLTSEEFDVLVARSPAWKKAYQSASLTRVDLARADQAFSTIEARNELIDAARAWLLALEPPAGSSRPAARAQGQNRQ